MKLGARVKDNLTGFEGVMTGKTEWLYGCVRIGIEPTELDKDGKPQETMWFDEQRVEIVKPKKVKISASSRATSGGPKPDPRR